MAKAKLKAHLRIVFGTRKELAANKEKSLRHVGYMLVMADAADQAKQDCPSIRAGGRAGQNIKKIKQQFIGVMLKGVGYYIYRRLPVLCVILLGFSFGFCAFALFCALTELTPGVKCEAPPSYA